MEGEGYRCRITRQNFNSSFPVQASQLMTPTAVGPYMDFRITSFDCDVILVTWPQVLWLVTKHLQPVKTFSASGKTRTSNPIAPRGLDWIVGVAVRWRAWELMGFQPTDQALDRSGLSQKYIAIQLKWMGDRSLLRPRYTHRDFLRTGSRSSFHTKRGHKAPVSHPTG